MMLCIDKTSVGIWSDDFVLKDAGDWHLLVSKLLLSSARVMLIVRLLFSFVRVHHLLAFRVLSYLPCEHRRLSLSFPFNALHP